MRKEIDYSRIANKLLQLANEYLELGEADTSTEYFIRAEQLIQWINEGAEGTPPFNLADYHIDVEEYLLDSIEKNEDETPIVSQASAELASTDKTETPAAEEDHTLVEEESDEADIEEFTDRASLIHILKNNLNKAQDLFQEGQYRESATLCENIIERSEGCEAEFIESVEDLKSQAKRKINERIDELMENLTEALDQHDFDEAEKVLLEAEKVDPEDRRIIAAQKRLSETTDKQVSETELLRLRAQLRDFGNLKTLTDAIRKARAMDMEGKLDDKLLTLLQEAEEKRNQLAQEQGEETSMMRFADLTQRAEAVNKIRARFIRGEKYIFDQTTGRERDVAEVLKEAEQLYKEASEDTISNDLEVIKEQLLPCYPAAALDRLEKYHNLPLEEYFKEIVEKKRIEVQGYLENKEKAEGYFDQVRSIKEPWGIYGLYLQAESLYPIFACRKIEQELVKTRNLAVEGLSQKIKSQLTKIAFYCSSDRPEEIEEALGKLEEVNSLYNLWPEQDLPENFQNLRQEQGQVRAQLQQQAALITEFNDLAEMIREKVMDPDQRQLGMQLFSDLLEKSEYQNLSQRAFLSKEIDAYKDVGVKILEMRNAEATGDWQTLNELTTAVMKEGTAGKLGPEIKKLFEKSVLELDVEKLKTLIARDELLEAFAIFEKLTQNSPEMQNRLANEGAIFSQCQNNQHIFKKIFDDANNRAKKRDLGEKAHALMLFGYLAGDRISIEDEELPDYELNFYTQRARKRRADLAKLMKASTLDSIRDLQTGKGGGATKSLLALQNIARSVQVIRKCRIDLTDEEFEECRAAELDYAKAFKKEKSKSKNWDEIYDIWNQLSRVYLDLPEIETQKREAFIQNAIQRSLITRRNEGIDRAMAILNEAINTPGIGQSGDILLTLAEMAAESGDFDAAQQFVEDAGRDSSVGKKVEKALQLLQRQRIIFEATRQAQNFQENQQIHNALIVIRDALSKPGLEKAVELISLKNRIFNESESSLVQEIMEEIRRDTSTSKINAVIKIMDLNEIEEIAEIPAKNRRSTSFFGQISQDLDEAVNRLMNDARNYDYEHKLSTEAMDELRLIMSRLRAIIRIKGNTTLRNYIGASEQELRKNLSGLSEYEETLSKIIDILQKFNQGEIWYEMVKSGDFSPAEQDYASLLNQQHSQLRDVALLGEKLSEYREILQFIQEKKRDIVEQFQMRDEFASVLLNINQVKELPALRRNGQIWKHIFEKDYTEIISRLDYQFRIADPFSAINGIAAIQEQAQFRDEELKQARNTENELRIVYNELELNYRNAGSISGDSKASQNEKHSSWKKVAELCEQIRSISTEYDQRTAHSRSAQTIFSNIKQIRENALNQVLPKVTNELDKNVPESFPDESTWNLAISQKNIVVLENLITQAEKIGAVTQDEEKRLRVARNVLAKWKTDNERPKGIKGTIASLLGRD